ncbi:hypothetical protein ACHAXA_009744 [Cyclostephanos tholiformis]|uniref:Uncharacterized protein n=1 Tax=Cyclostephanos tholiformis TaxID=382380 RepID=A0ABD3R985_9STRA
MSESAPRRKRKHPYPHGAAIKPDQVVDKDDIISDFFVTMCFFARLGFVQPPTCLRCAYRSSGCGVGERSNDSEKEDARRGGRDKGGGDFSPTTTSSCNELVPWRRDANIPLHPDKLEGNISFITCDTAKSLVNGDAYPSLRWDAKHKRLLHEV